MIRKIIYAFALLVLVSSTQVFASPEGLLKDLEGKPRQLEDYTGKGRWLVVVIWASDCHVCDLEMPEYAGFHKRHAGKDAEVLGISLDGEEKILDAEQFIESHDLPFENLIAEPEQLMLYYMMLTQSSFVGTPTLLVYDPEGQLRAAQAGAVPVAVIEDYIAKQSAATASGS